MSQFMIDLLGPKILEEEMPILQHDKVGSVLLFTRNFENTQQLQQLTQAIHDIRPDIFIALDQEGGNIQRFQRHGFRALPAARVYGDVYDLNPDTGLKLAGQYGELMANDLLSYGIDLSLAPVLDLHDVSDIIAKLDRAFHHRPEVVAAIGLAFIQGMRKAGMPNVGKHFPGHGRIVSDSHLELPISSASKDSLYCQDLLPFTDLMQQQALDAVMPAHVVYKSIDPHWPTGFSKIWLQNILRQELKFQGLVLSDCLSMAGADIGTMDMRVQKALEAGCDMLIVCNQPRRELYALLQSKNGLASANSSARLNTFKKAMLRFSDNPNQRSHYARPGNQTALQDV